MTENYGIKNLYQAMLLAKDPIVINGINYSENDIVLLFDEIQEITFRSFNLDNSAFGGYHNRELINWNTTKEISCLLNMGTISRTGYGLVTGEIINSVKPIKAIRQIETGELQGKVFFTKHIINTEYPCRVFSLKGQIIDKEILDFSISKDTIIIESEKVPSILIDYYFSEEIKSKTIPIGSKTLSQHFKFVGKFYCTDEETGVRKTALIEIPNLKIRDNFNLQLGRNTNPFISVMEFSALPESTNGQSLSIIFLDKDIDEDI